ncbi:MAG: hypothetical protein Q8938_08190, partial [Bacteroidota bacterium]|nr:hypothetical protein [Bacteroidota bacterium]
ALQVADEIWLLRDKGGFDRGAPEDLVLTGVFGEAFYKEGIRFDTSSGTFHIDQEQGPRVRLIARGAPAAAAAFWTKRALGRYGFTVVEGKETTEETVHSITVTPGAGGEIRAEAGEIAGAGSMCWTWEYPGVSRSFPNIAGLLDAMGQNFPAAMPK